MIQLSILKTLRFKKKVSKVPFPQILYRVYRYVIAINHFKDELYIFEHIYTPEGQEPKVSVDGLETLEFFVKNP
jgi:anthranilate synthase component I